MPKPKEVYDDPDLFLDFIICDNDRDFEGQYFDRKELCRPKENGRVSTKDLKKFKNENIAECLSAFANENQDGGLLILGVSGSGELKGLTHLNENQVNEIGNFDYLITKRCQFKLHEVQVEEVTVEIALVYIAFASDYICETNGSRRKAWRRAGIQNIELNDNEIESIKRDKRIVDFERSHCSKYEASELDKDVFGEFTSTYLTNASYDWQESQLLEKIGATDGNDEKWFTNAGKLFFSINPERDIPQAYIRLLRFDVSYDERENRPTPTFDKNFTGSITKQIRDFRIFVSDSAIFETYQRRNDSGGFIEEPEYPKIAIDEAVVNAVAHRDYCIPVSILCEKYIDAFVVINPGSIVQNTRIPEHFSLEDTSLEHYSRNPKLIEWLRTMKDANGKAFVMALQEGTRRMRDEVAKLQLPAPEYINTETETRLILRNNHVVRKNIGLTEVQEESPEYSNMYPMIGLSGAIGKENSREKRREVSTALKNKLIAHGWFIDRDRFGKMVVHEKGNSLPVPPNVSKIIRLFPAFIFQIREYFGKPYLLVDYTVTLQSVMNLSSCLQYFSEDQMIGKRCIAKNDGWSSGRITEIDGGHSKIALFDFEVTESLPNNKVIPYLPQRMIVDVFSASNIDFDLSKTIKKYSLSIDKNASRVRAKRTQNIVDNFSEKIFPLDIGESKVSILNKPLRLSVRGDGKNELKANSLKEPSVEFSMQHSGTNVREGITEFGSYENNPKNIEIVPVCHPNFQNNMKALIDRLKVGKYKYKGIERTFGMRLTHNTVICSQIEETENEIERLLEEHPDWKGNKELDRIFLIQCPESGYASDDESSPYYRIKRLLFESGIPCQMINTPTLINADWKDLNLALNIAAKCGRTPWVLPESIPDCDFFIGLSYTESKKIKNSKLMAFANVFNQYGRWEFYSGGSDTFSFNDKATHYEKLVFETMSKLALSDEPNICFHYSAKFSKDDKIAILKAARKVRPKGTYSFVWINMSHNVRFYDNRVETDGSISRGRYVIGGNSQAYLSTTGNNPYRRAMGTPQPLEINVTVEKSNDRVTKPDLRIITSQILSLTKLNWASTDSLCAEPITTKYAGNIAYLTSAFLRQGQDFKLHPVLEETPWFI